MVDEVKKIADENIENRVARVFVSSTFLDMKQERDYLGDVVFPRIKTYCKKRGVEFAPIDLRWGITEEQGKNGKTLEICLKEIDRSRPFFICLLGERYGSPISLLEGELDKVFLKDYPKVNGYKTEDIGVTEAEIRHGVLDLEDKVDAHFWFRSPASSGSCDPRLTALKERIRKDPRNYPIDEYVKPEDSQNGKSGWLEKLGAQIESALTAWINKTWPDGGELSWLERQNLDQSAFERSRRRLYVPNSGDYDALDAFADGVGDSRVLAVTGESGLGKSSLLINWANHYRQKNSKALILTHYVSASEGSDQPENILRRLTVMLKKSTKADVKDGNNPDQFGQGNSLDDWKKEFWNAVNERLAKGPETSLILVIDGLNQLSESGDAKNLAWLPEHAKTKVIVSTIDSDEKTVDAIKRREWKTHKAQPLTSEQKYKIIEKTLNDRGRSLSPERAQKIVESPIASNPLALYVLLDELCCFTDFKIPDSNITQLDLAIDHYSKSEDVDDLLAKIFERVEKSLSWLNETANKDNVVPLLASLIGVSRYGLTDDELRKISGYSQLAVSTFLSVFDAHLVDRSGRYSYSHGYIRTAIEERYASRLTQTRELLASSFQEKEEFKRRCQEVPWQLKELGQWERLYEFLLDFDVFNELYDGELTSDFCLYWNELSKLDEEKAENEKIFKFDGYLELDDSRYDDEKKARLWHNLGYIASTYKVCKVSEKAYNKSLTLYRDLANKSPEVYNPYIANTLNNLGILHRMMGSYSESKSEYKESLTIYRDLAKDSPEVYNSYVATTLNNLGDLHQTMGAYSESESELEESLSIYRDLANKSPEVFNRYVANTLLNLGALHQTRGSYSKAESEYAESLTIYRALAKKIPEVYNPHVASTLNYLGNLHHKTGSYVESNSEYEESLKLYRNLAKKAPEVYNPHVAGTLNNHGNLHSDMGSYSKAESEYAESLTFYRALAKKSPEVYKPDVANTLNGLGILHKKMLSYSESESELAESLTLYRGLSKKSPEVYNPHVASTLNNLGNLHSDMGSYSESESEYAESLTFYRALAKKAPEVYKPDVANTLNGLGNLHQTLGSYSESESELKESLILYRVLANKSPEVYNPNVARTLSNLGALHQKMGSYSESESELKESLILYRVLANKSPEVYNPNVAMTLFNLAILYGQTERYDLSKNKLLEFVDLYEKLPKEMRLGWTKQIEIAREILAEFHKIEENQYDPHKYLIDEYANLSDSQDDKAEWLEKSDKQIETAFTAWINKTWPDGSELNWLEKQNLEQDAFERSRSRLYVSNPSDYDALDAFTDGGDSRVLAITGKSGLGKSSLLINWAKHYRQKSSNVLVLTHYVSTSEGAELPENVLRRLTETLDPTMRGRNGLSVLLRQFGHGKSFDDWKKEFVFAVNKRLSKGPETSLVLVIDGLNQLPEYGDAKNLTWLPEHAKAKVIVSTVDSDEKTVGAIKRHEWKTYKVQPLTVKQKNKIIEKTLVYRGRSLSSERTKKIAESKIASNPLALCVLLDELCCFTDFKLSLDSKETQLDLAIDHYSESEDVDDLLTKIFERVEASLSWLNKTTDKDGVVPLLASLIAVSRYGLTDDELRKISGYSHLAVSTFLRVFNVHLVDRSGRYSYSHECIRTAIEERYASRLTRSREILADSFREKDEFKRRCQEVPWQLKELGEWNRLYEFLLDFDVFDELYDGELTSDFCLYWNELSKLDEEKAENEKIFKFDGYLELDDSRYDDEKKARLWHNLGYIASTYKVCKVSEKAYNKSLTLYRDLANKSPEVYNPYIANTLNNLGHLHSEMGMDFYPQSESELKESLTLYRGLAKNSPDIYNPDVANTLNNLGLLHRDIGLFYRDMKFYSQAESEYEKSLAIFCDLASKSPEVYNSDVAVELNNLGLLHRDIGLLHRDMKFYSQAESEYEKSLAIFRDLASKSPEVYNPRVATTLNNLGLLHSEMGFYSQAESEYEKSLTIFRDLASKSPEVYNPDVAKTLYNLGLLHHKPEFYSQAESEYEESLTLYRALANKFPEVYTPNVAMTLNNLGALHYNMGAYVQAESEYEESLTIRRGLASKFPEVYNPDVAMTLNNLGALHVEMGSYAQAESEYEESLMIYCDLASKSPDVYNPDVAGTLFNLAHLNFQIYSYELALTKKRFLEFVELYEKLPKAIQFGWTKQIEIARGILAQFLENEEEQ